MKKPDFLDEVSDEMDKGGDDAYGADMEDEGGDDEGAKEDKIMAAKAVGKALGITVPDPSRFADALEAFWKVCESGEAPEPKDEDEGPPDEAA
jgi:hypothetical protein